MSNNFLSSFELARSHSSAAQQRQKRNYDARIHSTGAPFQEGDKVWLARSHRTKGRSPKLDMRWDGPFVIVNKFSDCIYRIKHCATGKKKVTHFDKLKKCALPVTEEDKSDELSRNGNKQTELPGDEPPGHAAIPSKDNDIGVESDDRCQIPIGEVE